MSRLHGSKITFFYDTYILFIYLFIYFLTALLGV